ncbi:oligopeptide/dipeptide ABC transporter ATP-binding protein [Caenimonas aquaedulcis]|uniref:ATP-binding cassette domain-containing protein n=1 Tax=Caenimonas aquaedulcis TaxID=2793270 RepID=A0A931H3R0_9BURK|nr:oligopeptide/dipeptide ABC transporter ATP-binding protein [Caenimonas aquaedulcis]MBG9387930.1 ATP-binding cassette domain-containing protein [Caenimonas aquaedulcis]
MSDVDLKGREPLLSVRDLHVHFNVRGEGIFPKKRTLKAVNGVSFDLYPGETLGIVGESGCGKSTLARALLNLIPASAGKVVWLGRDMSGASGADWQKVRRNVQMVFQDPLASLNPRMNIAQIVGEPLRTHRPELTQAEVLARVKAMLVKVGMNEGQLYRYPHEFSGGQCQRIGIARALILEPKLIVCDEPVSALDVSIQAQIINLLKDLQAEMHLALVFIAHDLAVVKHVSQRILVMYLGRVMELAQKHELYADPKHPYTRALLSAVPLADPKLERGKVIQMLTGDLPSPIDPPSGCVFRTRCPHAFDRCAAEVPPLKPVTPATEAACWLY